ncbi:hypothetical protein PPYR_03747 [Photinus pyralis]|uniref:DDE-1 domain-containing protein n=1 Tax=Photinus pyralis TaxID=7054 RepID=A0A5N4A0P5_PHOPY|nr:hypothetical protein PPYR_03747 [Photinus pyralis]
MIADGITKFCEWGFPITRGDIRLLDKFPGPEWFYKFLQRQNILTERFAQNIKRCRANISKEIITEYFQNLEESLDGVEPTHIVNYDETNLTDDPGSKRVERIMDVSKSSTSVMMAITAAGHL